MEGKANSGATVRIAIDAMGGDYAPDEIVKGASQAAREAPGREIILVGHEEMMQTRYAKDVATPNILLVNATEVIQMDESPATAVKSKVNSSIVVGAKLVRDGQVDAFISAGNTGAVMASAFLYWGRIKGVPRPTIATVIPSIKQPVLLLDAGANADCRPEHLLEFALLGTTYAQRVLGRVDPKVGLVSIGEEESKGNELTKAAYDLLKASPLNFVGNIESREIPCGTVDIAVCDGFTGNIILKTMEGTAETLFSMVRETISQSLWTKLGGILVKPALKRLAYRLDFEEYGGAPLLGVNGVCIICHGRSKARAIKNAINVATKVVTRQVLEEIKSGFN